MSTTLKTSSSMTILFSLFFVSPVRVVAQQEKRAKPPNVLFIAIDDLNDWVGCLGGNPQAKTPNLDRFASEGGIVFTKAYCPSTVCCPSRTAILTGKNAANTGVYGNKQNLKQAPKAKDVETQVTATDEELASSSRNFFRPSQQIACETKFRSIPI